MIPRYTNIASLESALSAQGYDISPAATSAQTAGSQITTVPNGKNKDALVFTLDPVTKVPNAGPKTPRWTKMPRIGKRRA